MTYKGFEYWVAEIEFYPGCKRRQVVQIVASKGEDMGFYLCGYEKVFWQSEVEEMKFIRGIDLSDFAAPMKGHPYTVKLDNIKDIKEPSISLEQLQQYRDEVEPLMFSRIKEKVAKELEKVFTGKQTVDEMERNLGLGVLTE